MILVCLCARKEALARGIRLANSSYSFSLTFKGNFFKFCTRMDQLYIEAGHLEVTVDEIWNCVYETEFNLTIG